MGELSEDCFYDHCQDCDYAACTDLCHRDQEFDWFSGCWQDFDPYWGGRVNEMQAVSRAALALNALASAVLAEQKAARTTALDRLAEAGSERVRVKDDDGEVLGTVSLTSGRTSARVADVDAYTEWVAARYPDRVKTVRVVEDAFTERVLHTAKATGTPVDTETGELIPGVEISEGAPGITVRPNTAAKERMRALLDDAGLLSLSAAEEGREK